MKPDVNPALFRQLLGRFATGVTVLTTRDQEGRPVGMTASSLASVSLTPPLLSVCIDFTADMHRALSAAGSFVINVLASDQEEISRRFAELTPEERFTGIAWKETGDGLVMLGGALAHIECERYADFPLGDHTLFVGRVTGGTVAEGDPLLYFRGGYGSFHP
ncbi:MAG TPA: flavin reductase family protein [Gemmatimonadales bacterium]|nr:flavin reductase family protein [Gemmatimonadales bacterium]